jgi:hypothetical protein
MEHAIRGVLSRTDSLRIRLVRCRILKHPHRDPGCRLRGADLLRRYVSTYRHALILLDREGSGKDELSRDALEREVRDRLSRSGWGDRADAIVIDPELEIWVWSDSPEVDNVLGWHGRRPALRAWLVEKGLLREGQSKPDRPKEALARALHVVRKPPTSGLFRQLAKTVGLQRCQDPAFLKLKTVLQEWFGLPRGE